MPFNKEKLPDPHFFYMDRLVECKSPRGKYMQALCPFHGESNPSFSVNIHTGSFRCFGCGVSGSDVLAFHRMQNPYQDFKEAATELGAWE